MRQRGRDGRVNAHEAEEAYAERCCAIDCRQGRRRDRQIDRIVSLKHARRRKTAFRAIEKPLEIRLQSRGKDRRQLHQQDCRKTVCKHASKIADSQSARLQKDRQQSTGKTTGKLRRNRWQNRLQACRRNRRHNRLQTHRYDHLQARRHDGLQARRQDSWKTADGPIARCVDGAVGKRCVGCIGA